MFCETLAVYINKSKDRLIQHHMQILLSPQS